MSTDSNNRVKTAGPVDTGQWLNYFKGGMKDLTQHPLSMKYTLPAGIGLGALTGYLSGNERDGNRLRRALYGSLLGLGTGAGLNYLAGDSNNFRGLFDTAVNTKNKFRDGMSGVKKTLFGSKEGSMSAENILKLYQK